MITDALLSFGMVMMDWIGSFLPTFNHEEGVILTPGTFFITVAQSAATLGVWIPWGVIFSCLGFILPVYLASLFFRVGRVLISHIPFVGGSG